MKVAVITPYYKEPRAWLERCLRSVAEQSHPVTHIVVADGHAQDWIDSWPVRHLRLDRAHGDYGNTPRGLGGLLAANEGFDAVCFLDADNWYGRHHVLSCVERAQQGTFDYLSTKRHMVREDGSILPLRIEEDCDGSHIDTNCYFLLRGAFHTLARWVLMPPPMTVYGDRVYLASLREEGLSTACTEQRTVHYLCTWAHLFRAVGEPVPDYAKDPLPLAELPRWYASLSPRDSLLTQRLSGMRPPASASASSAPSQRAAA